MKDKNIDINWIKVIDNLDKQTDYYVKLARDGNSWEKDRWQTNADITSILQVALQAGINSHGKLRPKQ